MTKLRKFSYIRQLSSGKWRVYSEDGKNLGTYDSKSKAEERLKDVEMFKHMDKNSSKSLSLDGCVSLVNKLVDDFVLFTKGEEIPDSRIYKIASREEPISVSRSARMAGLKKVGFHQELKKNAFFMYDGSTVCQKKYGIDTRRIDQEHERVPRGNLQYWNRSQQFVDDIDYDKLNAFARLLEPLSEIKDKFGADPEYFWKSLNSGTNRNSVRGYLYYKFWW